MSFFEKSSLRMNYEVIPNIVDHDTLLIHGNLASNTWWQPFLSELGKRGPKKGSVIMAEWRGCGKTSAPQNDEQLLMPNLANDYLQLLKHLKIPKVNVVGHSTGGLIALWAMAQEPHTFGKCVLLDSVLPTGVKFEQAQLDAFDQMKSDRAFCEAIMAATIHGVDLKNPLFQQIVDDAHHVAPEIWHGIPKALQYDYTADLRSVQHPILFLQGELDPILPASEAKLFAQARPNVEYREITGHGHSLNVEDPARFTKAVTEFLFI